jgi:uncharacterized protein YlbG (UPF0298 family)
MSEFLTDEFVQFSSKIAELHTLKKVKQAEFAEIKEAFQKKYEMFKTEMADLDNKAAEFVKEWKKTDKQA